MFENIIEQPAVTQVKDDITLDNLAQSMLFFGPSETAKGSTALELARVISCEKDFPLKAQWKCGCSSCEQHRFLQHDDLIALGKRKFPSEIAAFKLLFLQTPSQSSKLLFYRALKKLQHRFSPVVVQEDSKISKFSSLLQSYDEKINDLYSLNPETDAAVLEKLCNALEKDAQELAENGISANIPISQIKAASYWCRLAPSGKRKTLIIENAENMREEARNSLLKLLEEPPPLVSIILTSQRKESVIPTILSRLRPYRFLIRTSEAEKIVLTRVFKVKELPEGNMGKASLITKHLDSFLPSGSGKLYSLAKWFTEQDFNSPMTRNAQTVKALLAQSNNFENDSFSVFLDLCLEITAENARKNHSPEYIKYYDRFKKIINETGTAVDVYNQSVNLALEALLYKLKTDTGNCHG